MTRVERSLGFASLVLLACAAGAGSLHLWSHAEGAPPARIDWVSLGTACVLLSFVFLITLALSWLVMRRGTPEETAASALPADFGSLLALAQTASAQSDALLQERGERRRAEENLTLHRALLHHSVEERVRLGRELHDNLSQTLYALCLTLESARANLKKSPAQAERQIELSLTELQRLNREVRGHLAGLDPTALHRQSFSEAVRTLKTLAEQSGPVSFRDHIDPTALGILTQEQVDELTSVAREAVSNSLRHGHPQQIEIELSQQPEGVRLAVVDDGRGFDLSEAWQRGHGLPNMAARAESLGGEFRAHSAKGEKTRIELVLPRKVLA